MRPPGEEQPEVTRPPDPSGNGLGATGPQGRAAWARSGAGGGRTVACPRAAGGLFQHALRAPLSTGRRGFEAALGKSVAAVALWSSRNAKIVLLLTLVLTGVFANGLTKIFVRSADYDLMPDNHPSTVANRHALNEVPGYRSIESVWIETRDNSNITAPAAIRAAYEAQESIVKRVNDKLPNTISYVYSLSYLVRLVNYTASGNPNPACTLPPPVPLPVPIPPPPDQACNPHPPDIKAFAFPPDDRTVSLDYSIIQTANFAAVQGVTNDKFTGTLLVFMYDFKLTKAGPEAVLPASAVFLDAVIDWKDNECEQSRIQTAKGESLINCPHVYVLGEAINAHMTDLANKDFEKWGPIVFVATLIVLVFAFSDLISTLIAALSFTIGLVWVYGFMGYAHMPLTFFGLLIVPITLGVGKEYAIYVTNQYLEYVAEGNTRERAFELVGHRAGAALFIASVTSIAGVATMMLAKFFIMRDLAILTCFSFGALFIVSITFIPAAQSLRRRPRKENVKPFRPSRTMGGLAVLLRKNRVPIIAIALVGTIFFAAEAQRIEEYFGISGGFKKGDYLEVSYNYYNQVLGGSGTELVVIEGDVADPGFIQYLRDLDASFKADTSTIPKASNVNSLIIALETYYSLRDGLTNPAALNSQQGKSSIPNDHDEVKHDVQAMFDSPVWGTLAALFVGKDMNMAVTHVFYHIKSETYASLKEDWDSLNKDIGNDVEGHPAPGGKPVRPASVKAVNLVGTQDTFYLYVTYGQPWLEYVSYMASFLTLAIAIFILGRKRDYFALLPSVVAFGSWYTGVFSHDLPLIGLAAGAGVVTVLLLAVLRSRDIAAIMIPMLLASVWWAGLLPLFDIKASLTLMLPTVFLISVGSDYAIQYVWNYREIGDMRKVYESTGKANLFVVLATTVAFLLFVPMKLVLSSQGALAAALAILTIFVVTTLIVPVFYPIPAPRKKKGGAAVTDVSFEPQGGIAYAPAAPEPVHGADDGPLGPPARSQEIR